MGEEEEGGSWREGYSRYGESVRDWQRWPRGWAGHGTGLIIWVGVDERGGVGKHVCVKGKQKLAPAGHYVA